MRMVLGQFRSVHTSTVGALCQMLLYYTLACNARVLGLNQKQTIGRELLQVLSGNNISDASRQARIESSIIRIPAPNPPKEWVSLSTAVKSEGTSAAANSLTRQAFRIPDVENATEHKCSLVFCPNPKRFREEAINDFVVSLFKAIAGCDELPTPKVQLTRYDLFHTHLLFDYVHSDIVLLFHAREYPGYDKHKFPYILGYCQADSTMPYEPLEMDFRNFVWYKDNLAALDTSNTTILGQELLFPGTKLFHTVFEEELGDSVVDIFYFDSLDIPEPEKLFVCERFSSKSQSFAV